MSSILPTLGKDVSIDIGSIQTRLMGGTRGTVISEPSIIATDTKQEKVVAVGDEAARLVLRMPDMWRPLTPLKDGFIVDYRVMHTMLSYFLNKVSNALRRARVVVGVPCGMTDVEQRAMMDAVIQACGVPIFEAQGSMVIDIGGGTIDMGIVSLGGIVDSKTIRFGGSDINNALLRYVRECFGVIVSDETILDIKHTLGTAIAPLEDAEYAFQGRDMMNGLGRRCVIHQSEVYQVVNECLIGLLDEVKQMIRATAPEIVADIMQHGIWLTGGTARLSGLADRIGTEVGVPVHVPEAPETKVVVGLNGASSDLVSLSRFIVNSKNRKGRD